MLLTSPLFLLSGLLVAGVVFLFRRLSSPLCKIPGPQVSKLTSLVLRWQELSANRTLYIHDLHLRYGPVVRVAPNEVSFTSWSAVKEIYCSAGSGYDKTDFYNLFRIYNRRTMFTTLNKTDHAKRKRILADRYANSNVTRGASMAGIQERSKTFVRRCTSAGTQAHDIFIGSSHPSHKPLLSVVLTSAALHAYACDCVTHHLFHPRGTDCLQSPADQEMMHQVAADDSLQNRLISFYSPTFHRLMSGILQLFAKSRAIPLADNYVIQTSQSADPATFTLMSRLGEKALSDGTMDATDAAAECLDHMVAGIDTTGDALCFLMWELSQPRSWNIQRRLQEELAQNPDAPVDQLPLLDAVVNEGLRCFPPIPMSLPRLVPEGGKLLDGVWLPENTIVSSQAYSVHRINSHVFPDPDAFNPDRWLTEQGDTERRRLMFAFSSGGRGCVGKHLAIAEMKTLLRDVYANYATTPDPSMTEESMAMSDQLISSRPLGKKCLLQFHPLDVEA